jgi:hypothetical protein
MSRSALPAGAAVALPAAALPPAGPLPAGPPAVPPAASVAGPALAPPVYTRFTRAQWAALRDNTPLLLSAAEIDALRGVNEPTSAAEVGDVLSRCRGSSTCTRPPRASCCR